MPNESSNLYKLNEHSTTSITDVDVHQDENTINNLILSTKLGQDSTIKQQQSLNAHLFSRYSKKNSNATQGHLNRTSTQEVGDSRIDSQYLMEAQGTGTMTNINDLS